MSKRGGRTMHIRIDVTDAEREMIKKAAKPSGSVSMWAEVNLVQLAQIETSHEYADPAPAPADRDS